MDIYKLCKKSFKRSQGNTSNLTAHLKRDHRHQTSRAGGRILSKKVEAEALKQVGLYVKLQLSVNVDFDCFKFLRSSVHSSSQ